MSSTDKGPIREIKVHAFQGKDKFEIHITPEKLYLKKTDVQIQITFTDTDTGTRFIAFKPTDKRHQICKVRIQSDEISLEDLDTIPAITIPYSIEVMDPSGKSHWSDPQIINKPR